MSNNGDRVVPLRITPDEKLDFWLSSLMSGIQLIRAAIGENTLIAFDPNLNPMRVPYLYGGFGLLGPFYRASRNRGLVFMHDVNT